MPKKELRLSIFLHLLRCRLDHDLTNCKRTNTQALAHSSHGHEETIQTRQRKMPMQSILYWVHQEIHGLSRNAYHAHYPGSEIVFTYSWSFLWTLQTLLPPLAFYEGVGSIVASIFISVPRSVLVVLVCDKDVKSIWPMQFAYKSRTPKCMASLSQYMESSCMHFGGLHHTPSNVKQQHYFQILARFINIQSKLNV
ncbi:hypothetical protein VNO77_20072 [Canavalia gladiata]|uniref:Uncharacterized protein n=1 Tax=Canavalia gladiata TaxID=3824 RepID=A0AAN9QQ79_CANGL